MQEGSGGSFQTAVGPKDPKRSKHTWRIIPGLVSSQDHPHLKAMKRPFGRGPTTPGLGDLLTSPWLLTTYPSHGMILQVTRAFPRHFRKFHAKTQDERSRQARATNLPRSTVECFRIQWCMTTCVCLVGDFFTDSTMGFITIFHHHLGICLFFQPP